MKQQEKADPLRLHLKQPWLSSLTKLWLNMYAWHFLNSSFRHKSHHLFPFIFCLCRKYRSTRSNTDSMFVYYCSPRNALISPFRADLCYLHWCMGAHVECVHQDRALVPAEPVFDIYVRILAWTMFLSSVCFVSQHLVDEISLQLCAKMYGFG